MTAITYPDGEIITQTYNARGLLAQVANPSDTPDTGPRVSYLAAAAYSALGQPTSLTYGNGTTTAYTYHSLSQRLTSIEAAGALTLTYAYDAMGNITAITDSQQATAFTYDPLDRLTGAGGEYSASYTYDAIGNLLTKSEGGWAHPRLHAHASRSRPGRGRRPRLHLRCQRQHGGTPGAGADLWLGEPVDRGAVGHPAHHVRLRRGRQAHGPDHAEGTTLFIGPLYEVFVPASATMPTITTTVHPTQTYTARLPVVTGSWHGVDGALGEVTKYYFADGGRIAMRPEGRRADLPLSGPPGQRVAGRGRRRRRSGTCRTGDGDPGACPLITSSRGRGRHGDRAVLLRGAVLRSGRGAVHQRRYDRAESGEPAGAEPVFLCGQQSTQIH